MLSATLTSSGPARAAVLDVTAAPFGAIANDGLDDAPAINAAVASAAPGDIVYLPEGTFEVRSTVSIAKSNLILQGASTSATSLRYGGTTSGINLVTINNANHVALSGFTLDGANSTRPSQGIRATNSSHLGITAVAVRDFASTSGIAPHGIHFAQNVTNSVIANSSFTNIGVGSTWGAGIRLSLGSSNNQVVNNTIANTGRGGILVNDDSTDLVIRNNLVTGSGQTSSGLGIEIWGRSHRAIVEDNHIDHWLSTDGSNNLAIRRNVISDPSGVYKFAGLEMVSAHDNVYTDNVVAGGARVGISISGSATKEYALFARNTVRGASTWGAQIQGESGGAKKLYFFENSFEGTQRNGPATLFAPQGHGVRFNGNATDIVFESNRIDGNEGSGLQFVGSGNSSLAFLGNTIAANNLKVVDGTSVPSKTTWHANSAAGNGDDTQPADIGANGWSLTPPPMVMGIEVGDTVAFDLLTSAAGAAEAVFHHALWDFGEGLPSTDVSPEHTFDTPGQFHVYAVGWDNGGAAMLREALMLVGGVAQTEYAARVPEPAAMSLMLAGIAISITRRRR